MKYSYNKPSNKIALAVSILVIIAIIFLVNANNQPTQTTTTTTNIIVCTQDAKLCPDNSYVSRDPANNCQFFDCPVATTTTITTTTITTTTTVTTTTIAGNQPPNVISAAAVPNPIRTGREVTFNVNVSDAESEFVTASICKNAQCTGRYCTGQRSTNPIGASVTCTYVIPISIVGQITFWAMAQEAGQSSTTVGPFTLNVTQAY
ncbi:MAG: hypothetical protein V1836_00190 [Candidatus Aenigmatarchaeota archaeon]